MTKAFENKVRKYGRVDTKNYRYMVGEHEEIVRIKIEYLDTMAAYDEKNWEVVKEGENYV